MRSKGNILLIVLASLILLIIIFLVGVEVTKRVTSKKTSVVEQKETISDQQINRLNQVSSSDEISEIEADIDNTDFSLIDIDLAEVNEALSNL